MLSATSSGRNEVPRKALLHGVKGQQHDLRALRSPFCQIGRVGGLGPLADVLDLEGMAI